MKRLRVAQIGVGHDHAAGIMECVLAHPEQFEMLGIVEEDCSLQAQINHTSAYHGLPRLTLEELWELHPDAVFVESCEKDLVCYAYECVARGIHVHMDKPGGLDAEAFGKLLCLAAEKELVVDMGYMYRTNPAVEMAREIVESGKLGEIYSVHGVMNADHDAKKREWLKQFPGGIMYFLGCHLIDLVLTFMGKPKSVTVFHSESGIDGVEAIDHSLAVFDYGNAVSTVETTSIEYSAGPRRQFVINGTNGTIEIKPLEWPTEIRVTTRDHSCEEHIVYEPYGRYDKMIENFYQEVIGEKENPYNYEYELQLQKLLMDVVGR